MIVSPRPYSLFPGFTITGAPFAATVIVNVAITGSFTPSFAVTVTVWARAAASAATVPDA